MRYVIAFLLSVGLLGSATAEAACGLHSPLSYGDIEAVAVFRTGCSVYVETIPQSMRCSRYWALFWPYQYSEYNQFNLPGAVGKYSVRHTLADAVNILRSQDFFTINPTGVATDSGSNVLEVERCSILTEIIVPNVEGLSPEADDLFDAFDALFDNGSLHKLSSTPDKWMPYYDFNTYGFHF